MPAARYHARGDARKAARFRRAARDAVDALQKWLAVRPIRHVKNLYPRGSGEHGSGIGCEGYAYFNKYMVTMGSWAMLCHVFADEIVPPCQEVRGEEAPSSFATSPDSFCVPQGARNWQGARKGRHQERRGERVMNTDTSNVRRVSGRRDFLAILKLGVAKPAQLVEFKYFTNVAAEKGSVLGRAEPNAETVEQALARRPDWNHEYMMAPWTRTVAIHEEKSRQFLKAI